MLAKEAFQSVCRKITERYEADGWKFLKSNNEMKKKSKNFTYSVSFYTSYSNISDVKVELYASFGITINKTKAGVWGLGTESCDIPHGQLSWNVATEDMWDNAIKEFTHWLETECFPVMHECEYDPEALVKRVVREGTYPPKGYHASINFITQFGKREQAEQAARRLYFEMSEKERENFRVNYESMINGGEAVNFYATRAMSHKSNFRCIIENKIHVDFSSDFEGMHKAPVRIDRIDPAYDRAEEIYCERKGVSADCLTDEQRQELDLYAGNHLGFFTAWLIQHDFIGEKHKNSEGVKKVKEEAISGTEFLIEYCNKELWSYDVSEEILPFVHSYCIFKLFRNYTKWVIEELGDLPMEFIGDWEDYHSFEKVIDKAYEEHCEKQKAKNQK